MHQAMGHVSAASREQAWTSTSGFDGSKAWGAPHSISDCPWHGPRQQHRVPWTFVFVISFYPRTYTCMGRSCVRSNPPPSCTSRTRPFRGRSPSYVCAFHHPTDLHNSPRLSFTATSQPGILVPPLVSQPCVSHLSDVDHNCVSRTPRGWDPIVLWSIRGTSIILLGTDRPTVSISHAVHAHVRACWASLASREP